MVKSGEELVCSSKMKMSDQLAILYNLIKAIISEMFVQRWYKKHGLEHWI